MRGQIVDRSWEGIDACLLQPCHGLRLHPRRRPRSPYPEAKTKLTVFFMTLSWTRSSRHEPLAIRGPFLDT